MLQEREQLYVQELADELSKVANKSVSIKLANDNGAASADASAEPSSGVELILDASVFVQIKDEECAVNVWRGMGYRALARLERNETVEARLTAAGAQVTEMHLLLEDAKRLANTRKQNPGTYKYLAALAQFECKLDTQLSGYPALFSKFRYRFMTNLPLQSEPARVTSALEKARVNIPALDSAQLVDLAEQIHECLAPKPKAVDPQQMSTILQGLPPGLQSLPKFSTAEEGAAWLKNETSAYLNSVLDKNDKRFGSLEMLQASLRVDCLEALPLRVQEGSLDQVMEIMQSVFHICRAIDALLNEDQNQGG